VVWGAWSRGHDGVQQHTLVPGVTATHTVRCNCMAEHVVTHGIRHVCAARAPAAVEGLSGVLLFAHARVHPFCKHVLTHAIGKGACEQPRVTGRGACRAHSSTQQVDKSRAKGKLSCQGSCCCACHSVQRRHKTTPQRPGKLDCVGAVCPRAGFIDSRRGTRDEHCHCPTHPSASGVAAGRLQTRVQ
jgi:hypothetical protein